MLRPAVVMLLPLLMLLRGPEKSVAPANGLGELSYAADGRMNFPASYREWIYLTSGLDMSYSASASGDHQMFDNVFVNPAAYRGFERTGTWPDKTVFVLEVRGAETGASINKRGHSQSAEVMGVEVHVKDRALPGGWGFFEFNDQRDPAKVVERPASCYSCHEAHGALDTTFVQFYPTLRGIAQQKGTLSPEYLREMGAPKS
jgi:hypothetical protein